MKMMHHWRTGLFALFGMLVVGALSAWAANCGDTAGPGGTDVPCSCGDTVVTTTILDAGTDPVVSVACPGDGLLIGANSITLDLGRNTIRGTVFTASGVSVVGHDGVTVQNGSVTTFGYGVRLNGSSGNLITRLSATENGRGIFLEGSLGPATGNVVTRNVITDNAAGIELVSANGLPRNEMVGNVVSGNTRGILMTEGSNNLVEKNTVTLNFLGIQITGGAGNLIRNNQSSNNDDDGILLTSCDGSNILRVNRVLRNLGNGLRAVPCGSPTGDIFESNIADGNTGNGLLIESNGNAIRGNRGKKNGNDGLSVTGTGNEIARNVFDQNGDWGICVDAGNVDSGGNRASRNVNGQISFTGACSH